MTPRVGACTPIIRTCDACPDRRRVVLCPIERALRSCGTRFARSRRSTHRSGFGSCTRGSSNSTSAIVHPRRWMAVGVMFRHRAQPCDRCRVRRARLGPHRLEARMSFSDMYPLPITCARQRNASRGLRALVLRSSGKEVEEKDGQEKENRNDDHGQRALWTATRSLGRRDLCKKHECCSD